MEGSVQDFLHFSSRFKSPLRKDLRQLPLPRGSVVTAAGAPTHR